jgi:hypothetical protein
MIGGMGAACTPRIRAKPSRPVTRRIVKEVFAIIGGASAEALYSVFAEVLGDGHQHIGHDLVVECG